MLRHFMWFWFAAVLAAVSLPAQAKIVQVGGCKLNIKNYPTISAAVGDPTNAGATIQVCAAAGPGVGGTYPEQVTIAQPLTLEGIVNGNLGRAVISVPTGPLSTNVTSISGTSLYAQVLVSATSGPVNITGITVDGTGGSIGCTLSTGLVGIFYGSGTTGTLNQATARNQVSSVCGYGIWVENGSSPTMLSITIENCSVENVSLAGIVAYSNVLPLSLQVTIQGNAVTSTPLGILGQGIGGASTIKGNVVTLGITGIESLAATTTVSSNVVADIRDSGSGQALYFTPGATAQNNSVSDADTAFFLLPGDQPGPILKGNATMNTQTSVEFNCDGNATVQSNRLTDSLNGFDSVPVFPTGNQFYDINSLQTGMSCI